MKDAVTYDLLDTRIGDINIVRDGMQRASVLEGLADGECGCRHGEFQVGLDISKCSLMKLSDLGSETRILRKAGRGGGAEKLTIKNACQSGGGREFAGGTYRCQLTVSSTLCNTPRDTGLGTLPTKAQPSGMTDPCPWPCLCGQERRHPVCREG